MRINWMLIKMILLLVLLGFLFGIGNKRNGERKLSKIAVEFVDDSSPFITVNTVNKLLIQSNPKVTGIVKETLVLKEMEQRLLENPMVRDAQVFVTVDGRLGAKIVQRQPLGRIAGNPPSYLDQDGKQMPLSPIYTARVPLITGSSKNNFAEVAPILKKINEDEFMKTYVVGINEFDSGTMELRLRKHDFKVYIGKPVDIEKKFQNFKAFYKKTSQDSTLTGYNLINLSFGNQVVATKKTANGK